MPCSLFGQMQPSSALQLLPSKPGSAGPPQARSSLPSASNSSTEGAARQQSAPKPLARAKPSAVDRLPLGVGRARQRLLQPDFVVVQGARAVIDPDMVVAVDIEPADLAEQPAMRQRPRPGRIGNEVRRLAGLGPVVDAGLLEQLIEDAALLQSAGVLRQRRGGHEARQHDRPIAARFSVRFSSRNSFLFWTAKSSLDFGRLSIRGLVTRCAETGNRRH